VEAANDALTVWVNTACVKDHNQKTLSKLIRWYHNVYNQIASDVWKPINLFISSRWTTCNRC